MSDLEQKAIDLLDKMETLSTKYAPDVYNAAVESVRMDAINDLVSVIGALIISIIAYKMCLKAYAFFKIRKEQDGYASDWEIGIVVSAIAACLSATIYIINAVFIVFNAWVWVGIFNPELALAHKIIGL